MVRRRRRHLLRPGRELIAACGQHGENQYYTRDPDQVDCGVCKRTLYMADAEIRKQQGSKRKR